MYPNQNFIPFAFLLACICVVAGPPGRTVWATSPNVVWIIADDLGPELACFGYSDVATPNIDRLANGGTRFTHAFATAPVCSSSRTAFVTGQYQTTVGGHHHDTRNKPELPKSVPTVVGLMQQQGYFVCNGNGSLTKQIAKSHFNFAYDSKTFFDGTDWTQRNPNQPFFATVQIKEPHRPFVRSDRTRPDAIIPPYYPDHPIARADWANYLASIEVLDQKVGRVLDRLDAEGLAENTLVIFFGDHGRPHVRGKQWLYDGGLHVPLIVRWPNHVPERRVDDRLVSLLDLMPTTLMAAGDTPPELPGHNLFDDSFEGHKILFAARDRCGDAVDRIRSVRTRNFKYIRNFYPELPYLQHSGYKKAGYPVETLMRVMHKQGRWDTLLMAETRPAEELYDLVADPHEMNNLSGDSDFQPKLVEMQSRLDRWIVETNDKGRLDESLTVDIGALKEEKWKSFERKMKSRGLDPNLSDRAYLAWWKEELGTETD